MKKALILVTIVCLAFSCTKEEVNCADNDYTYNNEIKSIIDQSCATAGCHNAGSSKGDFTSYANMKYVLDNGEFNNRVFVIGDMPKGRILAANKKSILQCWMENNFKEQ